MGLNESKGNMYDFVTHTWNTVKGKCYHDCSYCYMKRWGEQKPARLDEKEFKTDLGSGNYIFVGSSCDLFSKDISDEWILRTIRRCDEFKNQYLFQTKNPRRFSDYISNGIVFGDHVLCTTIESNRWYPKIMGNSPQPQMRFYALDTIKDIVPLYLTIEPILDFNINVMVEWIKMIGFKQVNIGADSGNNNLPEPEWGKVQELIQEIEKVTVVKRKKNLDRLARQDVEP